MQTVPTTYKIRVCDPKGVCDKTVGCKVDIFKLAKGIIGDDYIEPFAITKQLPPPKKDPKSAEESETPWTWPTFTGVDEEDEEGSRDRNEWLMCLSALVDEEGRLKHLPQNPTIKCFLGPVVLHAYLYENNVGETVPIDIERIPRDLFEQLESHYSCS